MAMKLKGPGFKPPSGAPPLALYLERIKEDIGRNYSDGKTGEFRGGENMKYVEKEEKA